MTRNPRMNRAPQPRPQHYPHHHHWWDDDWYWDNWYWDDWYWDDDWYYRGPKQNVRPNVDMTKKPSNNCYDCEKSNYMAYQQGYKDGFAAGVEYTMKQEPTEPTQDTTEVQVDK